MSKLIKQFLKFTIVGGLAFIIDYGVFALLTTIGLHYLISQVISFIIALTFNYFASIKWVFNAKEQTVKEIVIFVGLSVIGLILSEILLYIGIDLLHHHELIVKFIASVIVMVYNFITRKLIIEKHS